MRTTIIVVLIALATLFYLNPGMDEFKSYVESRSEEILLQEVGDNTFGQILSDVGSSLAGRFVDRVTERNNFFVFSLYTIDLEQDNEECDNWIFLGIAGRFIELQKPESLDEKEYRP